MAPTLAWRRGLRSVAALVVALALAVVVLSLGLPAAPRSGAADNGDGARLYCGAGPVAGAPPTALLQLAGRRRPRLRHRQRPGLPGPHPPPPRCSACCRLATARRRPDLVARPPPAVLYAALAVGVLAGPAACGAGGVTGRRDCTSAPGARRRRWLPLVGTACTRASSSRRSASPAGAARRVRAVPRRRRPPPSPDGRRLAPRAVRRPGAHRGRRDSSRPRPRPPYVAAARARPVDRLRHHGGAGQGPPLPAGLAARGTRARCAGGRRGDRARRGGPGAGSSASSPRWPTPTTSSTRPALARRRRRRRHRPARGCPPAAADRRRAGLTHPDGGLRGARGSEVVADGTRSATRRAARTSLLLAAPAGRGLRARSGRGHRAATLGRGPGLTCRPPR